MDNNAEAVTFTPDDLINAVKALDVAADNGGFRGWEQQQKALMAREKLVMLIKNWQDAIEDTARINLEQAASEQENNND